MRVNLITATLYVLLVCTCEVPPVLGAPNPKNESNTSDPGKTPSFSALWNRNSSKDDFRALQSKLMQSYMNTSADPCADFYEYACGNWENVHPMLNDQSKKSVLTLMNNNIQDALREILLQTVPSNQELSAEEKARVYFAACLDDETINKRGKEPLLNFIKELGGWPVLDDKWSEEGFDWFQLAIKMASLGYQSILSSNVDIDYKNSSRYTIYLEEANFGAGNQHDFLRNNKEAMDHYRNFIVSVLKLLDVDAEKAKATAKEIVDFETQLAYLPSKNPRYTESSTTIEGLSKTYPHIDWLSYFSAVVQTPLQPDQKIFKPTFSNYFDDLTQVLKETPSRTVANFMVWQTVHRLLDALDVNFRAALQNFQSSTRHKKSQERWKGCLHDINEDMSMAMGAMFVREYFNEDNKNEAVDLFKDVKESFREILEGFEGFMDEKVKELALDSVNKTKLPVGYPDFILNPSELNKLYSDLQIVPGKNFENSVNLQKYSSRMRGKRVHKTIDEDQGLITYTEMNSLARMSINRIGIPAGILLPPMFHKDLPRALNYGAIGVLMGYAINIGFDERINRISADANISQWWTPPGEKKIKEEVECFHNKYFNVSVDGVSLRQSISFTDNVADNGAMRTALGVHRKKQVLSEVMPNLNLTNDQLFFLGYAQSQCGVVPETIDINKHAPGKLRMLGTLPNFREFAEAFKCPTGSVMNPAIKCQLW